VLEHDEFRKVRPTPGVMPAKAGIHLFFGIVHVAWRWIPAFAGMTTRFWHANSRFNSDVKAYLAIEASW
jgi:hypothetical protein